MKVITRQTLANTAAEQWKSNYFIKGRWMKVLFGDSEQIYKQLAALGPNPNPDDVDAIIGNNSWTSVRKCCECSERGPVIVQVGEPVGYESHTAYLCSRCLGMAALLAESVEATS